MYAGVLVASRYLWLCSRYAELEDSDATVLSGAAWSSLAMSGLAFSVAPFG